MKHISKHFWLILVLLSMSLGKAATIPFISSAGAESMQPASSHLGEPLVIRIPIHNRRELESLVGHLDIWEVHLDEYGKGYVVTLADPAQQMWLMENHFAAILDSRSYHPSSIPGYECYRTIDELYAELQTIHASHTEITELVDIGDSFEGRDIWVIRITNQAIAGPKPVFFLIANVHGRELITNEAAMVYVDHLTDNYGVDPDVTWLVDFHEIHVSVSANPDGHVKNEPGEPWTWWRKNANSSFCPGGWEGVDLNRNSSFGWNSCPSALGCSSDVECNYSYRGPSAASEDETAAVEGYALSTFPDQRQPPLTATAPITTSGVFITLHSYGNLVLWPWGMTVDPPPNAEGLSSLGRKLAAINGYMPTQASGLYPADGTTDDWAYGEMGIAAYTFEIGNGEDGFYPPCSRYDDLIQPNISALLYASKVVRTPYVTSHGPDVLEVHTEPTMVFAGTPVTVTAVITDILDGQDSVSAAELYVDTPPWLGGTPVAMTPIDAHFGETGKVTSASLETTSLSPGRHVILVRGQNEDGYWGPFTAAWLSIEAYTEMLLPVLFRNGP
jgi:carboxypeptidase T